MEIYKLYKKTHNKRWGTVVWEVSNYGNVKKNGELYECGINVSGYKCFAHICLHKAVAELFVPNPDNKPEVDHIDTNKINNRVDNLRWATREENQNNRLTIQHFMEVNKGENNGMAKKCVYNNIEFGCIKYAWEYAKTQGYNMSYRTFCNQFKG